LPDKPRLLAMAVLSAIIVNVSYQDSDTRYSRKVRSYHQGYAIRYYKNKLKDVLFRLEEIEKLPREKCEVRLGDSRNLDWIADNSIRLIVTSPPYLNAYDYHKYHRHRLHWINGDINFARDIEIGKHDDFSRPEAKPDQYFKDMRKCFVEWYRVLSVGSRALIVIGDAIVSGKPVSVGDEFTGLCKEIGFKVDSHWIRKINKNKKSFNRQARIDEEHLILIRKIA
jgi:DNA modification methylase